jgi:hypothetical protein
MLRTGCQVKFLPLLVLFALCGCNGGSPFHASPTSVAKTFYSSCNAGEYSKAEATLTPDAKKFLQEGLGVMAGGIKGVCDKISRNGTLTSVDVTDETIRGEGATVTDKIHYKDGTSIDDHGNFMKIDGSWLITLQ